MEKEFDYKDGLKIIKYMKNKAGLNFSFYSDSVQSFIAQFNPLEGSLIEATRKAYGLLPFSWGDRKNTVKFENRIEQFDLILHERCLELLNEPVRRSILKYTTLNDVL